MSFFHQIIEEELNVEMYMDFHLLHKIYIRLPYELTFLFRLLEMNHLI